MAERKKRKPGPLKLGWCLTGHHAECWQMIPNYTCACDCHGPQEGEQTQ